MAGYLFFRAQYIDPILSGRKTQTLRRTVAGTVITSDLVYAMSDHRRPPFCALAITAIDRVHIDDLTRADARREGLGSLPELIHAVTLLYPDSPHLIRLKFRLV